MTVVRDGVTFHVRDGQDIAGLDELWGDADPYQIRGRDPKTVVDVGGNIGLFSVLIAHLYPDAQITTLEPYRPSYEVLCKNVEGHRITPRNAAVWSDRNGVAMRLNEANYGCTRVDRDAPPDTPSVLLDSLLLGEVDILKIDTEGSEHDILLPATRLANVAYLCMEYHDWAGDEARARLHSKLSETHDVEIRDWIPNSGAIWLATRR